MQSYFHLARLAPLALRRNIRNRFSDEPDTHVVAANVKDSLNDALEAFEAREMAIV